MSDAPSGFKSARVQLAGQRASYEKTTHLRTDRRSQLEPAPTGFAGNDLVSVPVPSQQNGLSVTHQLQVRAAARSAGVERRRVFGYTHYEYDHAGGQDV